MFRKVLLAEDIDIISKGMMSLLHKLHIQEVEQAQYCDDAFTIIKNSQLAGSPIDLMISDISFAPDHRKQAIESGEALISKVKKEYSNLKIIVYSLDNRPEKVRHLIADISVEAYVLKGRTGLRELEEAILKVAHDERYLSPELTHILSKKSPLEILEFDIEIMEMLSQGLSQEAISKNLKKKNIKPCSLSAIEKRLNVLKNHYGAKNTVNLISIAKDLGLI